MTSTIFDNSLMNTLSCFIVSRCPEDGLAAHVFLYRRYEFSDLVANHGQSLSMKKRGMLARKRSGALRAGRLAISSLSLMSPMM